MKAIFLLSTMLTFSFAQAAEFIESVTCHNQAIEFEFLNVDSNNGTVAVSARFNGRKIDTVIAEYVSISSMVSEHTIKFSPAFLGAKQISVVYDPMNILGRGQVSGKATDLAGKQSLLACQTK